MANEEKLMELLRRAHTVIGEGLIENALDDSAQGLHNEIAEILGLPVVKRGDGALRGDVVCRWRPR